MLDLLKICTPMRAARMPVDILPGYYGGSYDPAATLSSTTTADDFPADEFQFVDPGTLTSPARRPAVPQKSAAHEILEIRFLSGLTWDELGRLFEVDRCTIHNWANGETLKPETVVLVDQILRTVQLLRRASSVETRLALLTQLPSGERPLDLLKHSRWEDAIAAVRELPAIDVPLSPHPDPQQRHPSAYLQARTDKLGPTGRAVPGRSRRIPRRTP